MTPATLRSTFPEFASTTDYPDAQVQIWIDMAGTMLSVDRWDTMIDMGTMLFTAHYLTIGSQDQKSAAAGGAPGKVSGPMTSKAVDKVSASYDTSVTTYQDAGFWNMTSYGIRFWQMARMVGAGGIQL
jgi:polyisoprenoid-binding protein YceI